MIDNYFKKIKTDKMLTILLYCFILFNNLFYNLQFSSKFSSVMKILLFISYAIAIVCCLSKYKLKNSLFIAALIIFTYFICVGDSRFITILFFIILIGNDRVADNLLKVVFLENCLLFIVNLIIGYGHINGLMMHLGTCIIQTVILFNPKKSILYLIIELFACFMIYFCLGSSQFLICMSLFFVLYNIGDRIKDSKLITNIFSLSFICGFIANYYSALALNLKIKPMFPQQINTFIYSLVSKLDQLMNYRLSLTKTSLYLFSFKLWGPVVDLNHPSLSGQYFNIDSSYIQLLQDKGLIITIMYLLLLLLLMSYFLKTKKYSLLIAGLVISFWAINEEILLSTRINFILVYLGVALRYHYNIIINLLNRRIVKHGKSNT